MPRHIVRTNPSTGRRKFVPRTNPSVMISADQLLPGDVIDMEDLGREHVIQGPFRSGNGIRFIDLYGNSIRLRPKEVVKLVLRENPVRKSHGSKSHGHRARGNPPIALQSHVGMLQQDVALILDRAHVLTPSTRFRQTSQGGLEFKGIGGSMHGPLFDRLRIAAAKHGFDALPSGDGVIMLPFGVRKYTHRHTEAFENPRGRRKRR